MPENCIILGDNLDVLRGMPDEFVNLIYIDPPFNTGKVQTRTQIAVSRWPMADGEKRNSSSDSQRLTANGQQPTRIGFAGRRYSTKVLGRKGYSDAFSSSGGYLAFLEPRLREAHRVLARDGTLCFHIDYREAHYCKILLDDIFGRESFLNEIIWAYDYGARQKNKWPTKHDTVFIYAKDPENYVFNYDAMERIPYMAPDLVGPEKAARGKTPTDVWWHTIVPTNGREKTGYPTQKPLGILTRLINIHSREGDTVLDFFAGSGTTGEAAYKLGRRFILVDENPEAMEVMAKRFSGVAVEWVGIQNRSIMSGQTS